jgi:hypothetical protein
LLPSPRTSPRGPSSRWRTKPPELHGKTVTIGLIFVADIWCETIGETPALCPYLAGGIVFLGVVDRGRVHGHLFSTRWINSETGGAK